MSSWPVPAGVAAAEVLRPAADLAVHSSWTPVPQGSQRKPLPRYEHASALLPLGGGSLFVVGGNYGEEKGWVSWDRDCLLGEIMFAMEDALPHGGKDRTSFRMISLEDDLVIINEYTLPSSYDLNFPTPSAPLFRCSRAVSV